MKRSSSFILSPSLHDQASHPISKGKPGHQDYLIDVLMSLPHDLAPFIRTGLMYIDAGHTSTHHSYKLIIPPLSHNFLSPTPTDHALRFPLEMLDGDPKFPRSCPVVVHHTELFPSQSFCLIDQQSCISLCMLVLISCPCSRTGQKGLTGRVPHWCDPLTGSGTSAMTGTDQHMAKAPDYRHEQ